MGGRRGSVWRDCRRCARARKRRAWWFLYVVSSGEAFLVVIVRVWGNEDEDGLEFIGLSRQP